MNNLASKSDAELRADKAAILRELSRRRRASRPKVRRQSTSDELERAAKYEAFRETFTVCWACGRDRKPVRWLGPWMANERAHIVNKPRVEDVRAVCCLCTICHRISHWERFANFKSPAQLTTADLLALKLAHDPDNYDPEFLQKNSVKRLEFPK